MSRSSLLDAPYARYLGLDQLFALQGDADDLSHPDEFQFRTVHLASELWLRLIQTELGRAGAELEGDRPDLAGRLLHRATRAADLLVDGLGLLETMTPADYHVFRVQLGDASGLQSPGYAAVRREARRLWSAFAAALDRAGASLVGLYEGHREAGTAPLHDLAEALVDLDTAMGRFRYRHLEVARRFLGDHAAGTGGQGVDFLRGNLERDLFPELWTVRGDLAARAGARPYGETQPG